MNVTAFRVLFLIENVPYRLDTRVRREAHTLQSAGGVITVICPRDGAGKLAHTVDGVRVYQYPKPRLGGGFLAHVAEYVASLSFQTLLTLLVALRHGFDVIHVANPPDLLWLVALPYKLAGKRFVFDHHDLVPELFDVRFGKRLPFLSSLVRWLERLSIRLADQVISTNDTFRQVAIERGGKPAGCVTVVRNGPWLARDFPVPPPVSRGSGDGKLTVGYLGIMNSQDRVDHLIEAAGFVRREAGREDIEFVLIGSGDAYRSLVAMRDRLRLTDTIRMPGTLPWDEVIELLSRCDICVQPDPPTAFNRHLTMNKLMEYMALAKATIAYDMPETRVSGGDAVHYVTDESPRGLARAIIELADEPERRAILGRHARRRVESQLAWEHQARALLSVYSLILRERLSARAADAL